MTNRDELQLLLDIPESDVLFGFEEYASTLVSAIISSEPRFTMGIYGDWGRGKTTLLNKIATELEERAHSDVVTVLFDAWRYQHEENLLPPLLDVIHDSLLKRRGRWRTLANHVGRLSKAITAATTISAYGVQLQPGLAVESWTQERQHRGEYSQSINELQSVLDQVRSGSPKRRVVILIDDLDRCLPHKAIQVVESIKVVLDVNGLIFIIALNQEIIDKIVENSFGPTHTDYLKKIIQLEFHLPRLRTQDILQYASRLQKELGRLDTTSRQEITQVVPFVVGENVREVKRFINQAFISIDIAQRTGLSVSLPKLVSFLAVNYRWPQVTDTLSEEEVEWPQMIEQIKEVIEGRLTVEGEDVSPLIQMIQEDSGLKAFLRTPPGKEFLDFEKEEFKQLFFYSAMTTEPRLTPIISAASPWQAAELIDEVLSTITPQERRMLQLRYGIIDGHHMSFKAIAREFAVSPQTVSRRLVKAHRKLRHPSRSKRLESAVQWVLSLDEFRRNLLIGIFGYEGLIQSYGMQEPTKNVTRFSTRLSLPEESYRASRLPIIQD